MDNYNKFKIGNKEIEVIKNPDYSDYNYLNNLFKDRYPHCLRGEPKTRIAYDKFGNHYVWLADTMHEEIKNYLLNNFNLIISNYNIIKEGYND
jgi:hypothetical protein